MLLGHPKHVMKFHILTISLLHIENDQETYMTILYITYAGKNWNFLRDWRKRSSTFSVKVPMTRNFVRYFLDSIVKITENHDITSLV